MTREEELLLAGRVRRWHTLPGLNQDIASHSWGIAVLMLLREPNVTLNLIKAALLHDIHEEQFGDMPSQAKGNPHLRAAELLAEDGRQKYFGFAPNELSDREKAQLQYYDKLEALHFLHSNADNERRKSAEKYLWNSLARISAAAGIDARQLDFFLDEKPEI